MIELPEPLVPHDVDLRDFAFMPLDVARLRDSGLSARATGDEFRAAVLLWCAAWHQVPAGSLPDDDIELSVYAGFGRVVKEWRLVREGALRGWTKCNDGRLYHSVIAEKANESWAEKLQFRWRKECDRVRKDNKKRKENGECELELPRNPKETANFPSEKPKIPAETKAVSSGKEDNSIGIPAENALKGQGQGTEGIDREREREGARAVSTIPTPTRAGTACRCMKAAGLTAGLSPSHPKLLALLGAGISDEELADAAADAVGKGKSFAYALAIAEGRRRDAATAPLPHHTPPRQTVAERRNAVLDEMTGRSRHATRPEPEPADVIDVPFRAVE